MKTLADHGAFNAAAQPTKFPAGLFSICTGAYDYPSAFCEVDGVYTNKAPGGIAYRCSFRVTEAAYLIERAVDVLALELKMDPAELRRKNFIQPEKFPYKSPLGWTYDSGNYEGAMNMALEKIGYEELRKEQEEKRKKGELMGIGISSFAEIVGAGPVTHFDIVGIKMFDSGEIRIHPTGKAMCAHGNQEPGAGTRDDLCADRRAGAWEFPLLMSRSKKATPIPLPTVWEPMPAAARRCRERRPRWLRARFATRRRRSPRTCWNAARTTSNGRPGKFFVKGAPSKVEDDPGHRVRRVHEHSAGHGSRAWKRSITTIRRT